MITVPNPRYSQGGAAKRLMQLGSVLSPWSYGLLEHHERAFESMFRKVLAEQRYDIVQFEFPCMAEYRPERIAYGGPAFILDEHNIEYDVARQMAGAGGGALRRAYGAVEWRKVRREERRAWARVDGCTFTSERDQEMMLADAPTARTAVVPNGVDLEFFQPSPGAAPREPASLLFFGAIDYYPNTDGVLFFLREIWPLLASSVPRVRLSIVGRRPPEVIVSQRSPEVEVTGAVDDLRPYLERATVVVVPLRLGGGTRLKILEAMAMGKAVVSTSLGAEGLDVVPGRDLIIADSPEEFAREIRRLLADPELVGRIGAAARSVMEARYGWRASAERLSAFYREVIAAREAG